MKKEKSLTLAQANSITLSRYDFTKLEKRCLYLVIKEVRRLYIEKDYREGDVLQKSLFDDMFLKIKPEQLQQLGDEVKDVYSALRKLRTREIIIDNEDIWIATAWILQAKHIKANNTYEVQVSKEIMPYFVELAANFTSYDFITAITLKSVYSQRFYELCCQYRVKGVFFLTVENLRYIFNIKEDTYQNGSDLKKRVIDIAQKELQELYEKGDSDIYFTYREKEKQGKKVISYFFDLYTKETEEQKQIEFATAQNMLISIINLCKLNIKNDKKYIERIKKELNLHPDKIALVYDKLTSKLKKYSKADLPAIIRFVLQEDFGIE